MPLDELGVGAGRSPSGESRAVWRLLCAHWAAVPRHARRATGSRPSWPTIFGVTVRPSAETADAIYDQVAERLAKDDFRPRALFERFGIEVLATTDDPCDDLAAHAALAADPTWRGRVVPTFRPDRYLEPAQPGWADRRPRLGEAAGVDTGDYAGYVAALEERRRRTSSPTAPPRPTTATPTSRTDPLARRGGADLPRPPSPGRPRRPRPPRSAGTCCWRWPGCRARTGW